MKYIYTIILIIAFSHYFVSGQPNVVVNDMHLSDSDIKLIDLVKTRKFYSLENFDSNVQKIAESKAVTPRGLNEALIKLHRGKGKAEFISPFGNSFDRGRVGGKVAYAEILLRHKPQGFTLSNEAVTALRKGDFGKNAYNLLKSAGLVAGMSTFTSLLGAAGGVVGAAVGGAIGGATAIRYVKENIKFVPRGERDRMESILKQNNEKSIAPTSTNRLKTFLKKRLKGYKRNSRR